MSGVAAQPLAFAAGESSASFAVTILDDDIDEGDEFFDAAVVRKIVKTAAPSASEIYIGEGEILYDVAGATSLSSIVILTLSSTLHAAMFGRYSMHILVYSVTVHLIRVLAVYLIARGMMLDISFLESLILVPPALVVTALPISVGGWGVREGGLHYCL